MSFGDLLRRGLAAGAAAGCLAAVMMLLVVEPVLRRALAVEEARSEAETAEIIANGGHVHAEVPVVDRPLQIIGGMGTTFVIAVLVGIAFAVVFAAVRHRLPGATDFGRSLVLAALTFGVLVLAPLLTIPANPPAVGDPGSVSQRGWIFLGTLALATVLVVAAFVLSAQLKAKGLSPAVRSAIVVAATAVAAGVLLVVIPDSPDKIAPDMGAQIVWDFRLAHAGMWAVLVGTLGVVFGLLVDRKAAAAEQAREAVPA